MLRNLSSSLIFNKILQYEMLYDFDLFDTITLNWLKENAMEIKIYLMKNQCWEQESSGFRGAIFSAINGF